MMHRILRRALLVSLLAALPSHALSQAITTMAAPATYPKLAFMGYVSDAGMNPVYIEELTHLTEDALRRTYTYEIIDARTCLKKLLEADALDLLDCRRAGCLRDAGRFFKARFVVAGTIEPLQGGYGIRLQLLDMEDGSVRRAETSFDPEKVFPEASLRLLIWDLLKIEDEREIERRRQRAVGLYNVLVRSATQHLDAGDQDRSLEEIDRAVGLMPDEAEAWMVAALAAEQRGDRDKAVESIEQGLRVDPRDVGALQIAGDYYERCERFDRAVDIYDRLVSIEPDVPRWIALEANALMRLGRHDEAIGLYRESLRSHPDSLALAVSYADALLAGGDVAGCVAWCSEVARRFPAGIEIYAPLGLALARLGKNAEALEVLEVYVNRVGPRADVLEALWPLYVSMGRQDRMFKTLAGLNRRDPRLIRLHLDAADACIEAGRIDLASEALVRAIDADPKYVPAYSHLVMLHQSNGSQEAACAYFHHLGRRQGRKAHLPLYFEALCSWLSDRPDQAIRLYLEVLRRKPDYVPAYIDLARIYMERKSYDNAEVFLERAAELSPECSEAYAGLGDLCFLRQEWARSKRYYQRAIALKPQATAAYHSLVEVLLLSGDTRDVPMVLESSIRQVKTPQEYVIQEYLACLQSMGAGDRASFTYHVISLAHRYHEWTKAGDRAGLNWDFGPIRAFVDRFQGRDRSDLNRVLDLLEGDVELSEFLEQMGVPDALGLQI